MKNYFFLMSLLIFINLISCQEKEKNGKLLEYSKIFESNNNIPEITAAKNATKTIKIPNDFNDKFIDADKFIDSEEYIQLDTNEKCLISEIAKLFFLRDNIIIFDDLQHKLYLFSKEGKFITQIGVQGRGPNEYNELTEVLIDYNKNKIIIYDSTSQTLFFYNDQGSFITKEKIYLYSWNLALLRDNTFLLNTIKDNNEHVPDIMNYQLVMFDVKNKIVGKSFSYSDPVFNEKLYRIVDYGFNVHENYVLFSPLYTNDIYEIKAKDSIFLKYHIDLGNKDYLNKLENYKSLNDITNALNNERKWEFKGLALEAGDYLFSTIHNAGFFFYNNKSGKLIYGKGVFSKSTNDQINSSKEKLPLFINNTIAMKGNTFVAVCYPSDILSSDGEKVSGQFEKLKKEVHYSDNPILVLYKVKNNL